MQSARYYGMEMVTLIIGPMQEHRFKIHKQHWLVSLGTSVGSLVVASSMPNRCSNMDIWRETPLISADSGT
jgi:hypothetical protein